jgi:small GTP-binding protein
VADEATFDLYVTASLLDHVSYAGTIGWSCDGGYISAWWKGSEGEGTVAVWTVDVDAAACRRQFTLEGISGGVECVVWSPVDSEVFAVAAGDQLTLFRLTSDAAGATEQWRVPYFIDLNRRPGVAFSPSGEEIALVHESGQLHMRGVGSGALESSTPDIEANHLHWSQAGMILAIGDSAIGRDDRVLLLSSDSAEVAIKDDTQRIVWADWAPDGQTFCTGGASGLVRIWERTGRLLRALEGHTAEVTSVSFSHDGRLLYSEDADGIVQCWDVNSWQKAGRVEASERQAFPGGMAAAPISPLLARFGGKSEQLEIYRVNVDRTAVADLRTTRTYANAKVVLIGDTGVGKSGLSLVLTNQPYAPTDSTHARQVSTLEETVAARPGGGLVQRETLLWDMAGQPGYRLIHQLHLTEVAVALIVFDARNEDDPFAGVRYWARSLRQRADKSIPAILVAARTDRGGIPVSRRRIDEVCDELGLTSYYETSARENRQIDELADAIRAAIDWSALPQTVSTTLFETIKQFLLSERDSSRVLATGADLYRLFLSEHPGQADEPELRASFVTCVRLLELRDLVRRLSFGGFILLRPELLDAYASWLIDAARAQPDGLGSLGEADALTGEFPLPSDTRLAADQERLLLIAMVEELLRHDVALRVTTDDGVDLVFPSQLTADPYVERFDSAVDVVFRFDGPVQSVYATLVVRLAHVAAYRVDQMWRNTSNYLAVVGGRCGLRLRAIEDGRGELAVSFDGDASEETKYLFEEYVHAHLRGRAVPETVRRERIFRCSGCGYELPVVLVRHRQARRKTDIECPVCDEVTISLLDREERLGSAATVRGMNATADEERDRAAATASIRGKEETGDYDVFLSYDSRDVDAVSAIAELLRTEGILPWMDRTALDGGARWYPALQDQITEVPAAAVFIGPHGRGPWQEREIEALEDQSTRREVKIIPVFLPTAPEPADLPVFLSLRQAIDFRRTNPEPLSRLVRAITGKDLIRR